MSPGVVVSRVLFAGNQLFRMEEFFVGALAYLICEDTLISMSSLTLHITQYTLDTTQYIHTTHVHTGDQLFWMKELFVGALSHSHQCLL